MKSPFISALESRVLLADGGMGTLLHARGVPTSACLDATVIENPDLVRRIHEEYIAAGADIIETDTFGGTRIVLSEFGIPEKVYEINHTAARLAREVADSASTPHRHLLPAPLALPQQRRARPQ